jgi:hypothetical protein
LFDLQENGWCKMSAEFELIDSLSFLFFTIVLYLLAQLSKRIGEVMAMKKYYYFYYAAMFFTVSASIIMLLTSAGFENAGLFGYGFFALGLTIALITSVKYWGWLIKELVKG